MRYEFIKKREEKVIAQYEAVRQSGLTNMFNKNAVQRIAYNNDFFELVNAIEEDYTAILENYSEWMELIDDEDIPQLSSRSLTDGLVFRR